MNVAVNEVLDDGKSAMLSPKQEVYEGTRAMILTDTPVKNAETAKRQAKVKRTVK